MPASASLCAPPLPHSCARSLSLPSTPLSAAQPPSRRSVPRRERSGACLHTCGTGVNAQTGTGACALEAGAVTTWVGAFKAGGAARRVLAQPSARLDRWALGGAPLGLGRLLRLAPLEAKLACALQSRHLYSAAPTCSAIRACTLESRGLKTRHPKPRLAARVSRASSKPFSSPPGVFRARVRRVRARGARAPRCLDASGRLCV